MKRRLFIPTATLAVVVLTLWPLPSQAQRSSMTQWEALVRVKLAGAALLLSIAGVHFAYDPYIGSLEEGTYFDIRVPMYEGVRYTLIGVCDDDCRNLNMALFDADVRLVGESADRTTTPSLQITPKRTQRYTVSVAMDRCRADYCYYGLGVYSK